MAYDFTTDAGRVRLLISDVDQAAPLFSTDEIDAFLAIADGVLRAAALALETVAANETLLLKHARSRGLELDGPAVGRELRMQAKQWRDTASEGDGEDTFLIAEPADGYDLGYVL